MNSRRKGVRGELELAHWLVERGFDARRGQQFRGGDDSPDIITNLPYHIEVKRTERLQLYDAMEQAIRDSGGDVPIVAHRRNRGEWLAIMRLEDLLALKAQ
jgi:Holliday junction resolvase